MLFSGLTYASLTKRSFLDVAACGRRELSASSISISLIHTLKEEFPACVVMAFFAKFASFARHGERT